MIKGIVPAFQLLYEVQRIDLFTPIVDEIIVDVVIVLRTSRADSSPLESKGATSRAGSSLTGQRTRADSILLAAR